MSYQRNRRAVLISTEEKTELEKKASDYWFNRRILLLRLVPPFYSFGSSLHNYSLPAVIYSIKVIVRIQKKETKKRKER